MIGQTLGQTFLTPDRNLIGGGQQQAQVGRQQQPADMVGQPLMDLDPVAMDGDLNLTQQYYSKAAALKQFQQSMLVSAGIDVTAPDLSNAASIQASDAFMQGLGELQTLGNMLKESQKNRQYRDKEIMSGRLLPTEEFDYQAPVLGDVGADVATSSVDPRTQKIFEISRATYRTKEEVEVANQTIQPYIDKLKSILEDPNASASERMTASRSLDIIKPATITPYAPQAQKSPPNETVQEKIQKRKELTSITEYKRAVDVVLGDSPPDEIIVDDNYREIAVYKTFQGRNVGEETVKLKGASGKFDVPFVIDYWYKAPDGKTYIRHVQPSQLKQNGKLDKLAPSEADGELLIPDKEIKNVGQMIEMMALNNDFDYTKDDFLNALDKHKLLDDNYRADDKRALKYDPSTGEEREVKTSKLALNDYREKVKDFAKDVKNMKTTGDGSRKMTKLPNGDILKIERGVFGYYNAWINDVNITPKNQTSSDELVNIIFDETDYFKGNKQQVKIDDDI